jgi:hypothetical protein
MFSDQKQKVSLYVASIVAVFDRETQAPDRKLFSISYSYSFSNTEYEHRFAEYEYEG